MPKDEPLAPNPPDGAIIDYALADTAHGKLELAIYNAQDTLVRLYRSTDTVPAPDLSKLPVAPEWVETSAPPAATAGAHRFLWDLHYTKPPTLTGGDSEPHGVWAPPGMYKVVLTVDGQTVRRALEVRPDPRLKLGPNDLRAQFDLARAVEAGRVAARAAIKDAAALRASLTTGAKTANTQALIARLDAIAGSAFDPFGTAAGAPRAVNTLADLSDRLDKLAQAVDGADAAPTPDAQAGFRQASTALTAARAALGAVRAEAKGKE
jgi:hypothetical protein